MSRNGYGAGFCGVTILTMAAARSRQLPTVSFDELDRVSDLHSKRHDNMAFSYSGESMLESRMLSKP
jgi:hypothetical protein